MEDRLADFIAPLLRSKDGHMLRGVAPYRLARTLVETGFTRRHTKDGNRYEVEEE